MLIIVPISFCHSRAFLSFPRRRESRVIKSCYFISCLTIYFSLLFLRLIYFYHVSSLRHSCIFSSSHSSLFFIALISFLHRTYLFPSSHLSLSFIVLTSFLHRTYLFSSSHLSLFFIALISFLHRTYLFPSSYLPLFFFIVLISFFRRTYLFSSSYLPLSFIVLASFLSHSRLSLLSHSRLSLLCHSREGGNPENKTLIKQLKNLRSVISYRKIIDNIPRTSDSRFAGITE